MLKNDALRCSDPDCGWEDKDYWYDTSEPRSTEEEAAQRAHHGEDYIPCLGLDAGEKPPCPECGKQVEPWLSHYRIAAVDDRMETFQIGDKVSTSRSEFNRLKREIEARHPGKTLTVNPTSSSEERAARDTRRHQLHEQRKRRGIDAAMVKKWDAAKKAGDPVALNNSLVDLAAGRQKPTPPRLRDRAQVGTSTD